MVTALFIFGGLVLLALGAEGLVRGSSSLALRLGISPLVVGLTIVAFGTGSPELVVSISAAVSGSSALALGNVIGSNISNVALILGVAALVRPMTVRVDLLRKEVPIMIAVTGVLWILLYDAELGRADGVILTVGSIAYTIFTYVSSRRQRKDPAVESEFDEAIRPDHRPAWIDFAYVISGLGLLVAGANVLVLGATQIARDFGISEVVIGLTVVAIGTSLPELATSAVSSYRNEPDIAFGNAIGSNVLNILAVLGVTAIVQPISAADVRTVDLAVLLGSAVLLLILLGRNYILDRVEGTLLLIGYAAYLLSLLQ